MQGGDRYAMFLSMDNARDVFDEMKDRNVFLWNVMIGEHVKSGQYDRVLLLYKQMPKAGVQADNFTYPLVLKACAGLGSAALQEGKEIHDDILRSGFESDVFVGNSLLTMHAKCGSIELARRLFDKMPHRDVVSWNSMIVGYGQSGHANEALRVFAQMRLENVTPNAVTAVSVLRASAGFGLGVLQHGKPIHGILIRSGLELNVVVGNSLIAMYSKCDSTAYARQLFDKIPERNVVSWNAMIGGYAQNGFDQEALVLFNDMHSADVMPDSVTLLCMLQACAHLGDLRQGKSIHDYIIRNEFELDVSIGNSLVAMYSRCGSIEDARQLFDKMTVRDAISWSALIAGYAQNGYANEGMELYHRMQLENIIPDSMTMVSVLQACRELGDLQEGKLIHDYVIKSGFESDVFVGNTLIDMYSKCGRVDCARLLFEKMCTTNVVSWNSMIAGYTQNGQANEALKLFYQMQQADVTSDSCTVVIVLQACAHLGVLEQGKWIHGYIIRRWFESDVCVLNALIDMYAKCGKMENARQVFDDMPERNVASWNTIILGYAQSGGAEEAMELFHRMRWNGVQPNSGTLVSILIACIEFAALKWGMEVHGHIIKADFQSNGFIGSVLVYMYARCGRIEAARQVFDRISERDVVLWSSMVTAYSQNGYANEALKLFRCMHHNALKANPVTLAGVLPACGDLASLKQGKEIHGYVIRNKIESNVFVCSSLIDMYAKCGYIEVACQVFEQKSERDVISWTAMIAGYGINGHGEKALRCFYQMREQGLKPNDVTFVVLLSACSHAGLVVEGWQHFDSMSEDYHITPRVEHYACMVDLLGRAGRLEDAENFIQHMPIKPNAAVWGALLGACRIHCNIELAERVAGHLFEIEPENTGNYILLSNIYAAAGRWDDVESVRRMMDDKGIKPRAGCSWIEFKSKVCVFRVGDKSHPQAEKIYAMLRSLAGKMKEVGYVPATKFVLHNVEEFEKENILCGHSERLAIAFGLINTCPGVPIRITKNIRVCGDCHSAIKAISNIVGREIIVRDSHRFHHFKDGACSCGDYW